MTTAMTMTDWVESKDAILIHHSHGARVLQSLTTGRFFAEASHGWFICRSLAAALEFDGVYVTRPGALRELRALRAR
jgi:hypothetical protein